MRIAVKVGTSIVTDSSEGLNHSIIQRIIAEISALIKHKHSVLLISSGAAAAGRFRTKRLPLENEKRAAAAIGQPLLMASYVAAAEAIGASVAQCLVARDEFTVRERYDNLVNTLEQLCAAGILPILNENDVTTTADTTLGDNDVLAAMIAIALRADVLLLLTSTGGLYDSSPENNPRVRLITQVDNADFELERLCAKGLSTHGTGGMLSKVRAARHAVYAGIEAHIADGRIEGVIRTIASGGSPGTKFVSHPKQLNNKQRWLVCSKGFGQLIIDDGARKALHQNKSLLLPGIVSAKGSFKKGEVVEIISTTGIALAYGKTNYGLREILQGMEARRRNTLPMFEKEIVHRNYMTMLI